MPRPSLVPKARLLRAAVEAKLKPELRRLSLLHAAAADIPGFPDWGAGSAHVRLTNRNSHSSLLIAALQLLYVQDSGDAEIEKIGVAALSRKLFEALHAPLLTRLGHRRWYYLPLDMDFQQAVDLFSLRYSPQEDPVWRLGHHLRGVLHRVESIDDDGWRWNIMLATIPRDRLLDWLGYDLETHWEPDARLRGVAELLKPLPEVGLALDVDCYRQEELSSDEWEPFVARSREKIEAATHSLASSYFGQEER